MRTKKLGSTGVRVSEYCLGTMTFGESWGFGSDEKTSTAIYHAYLDSGGNFIDTADVYTNGEAEEILGKLIKRERKRLVLATKYSLMTDRHDCNSLGNHRKNLRESVETSLARLDTDYLDILWIHAWYFESEVEDVLISLDALVRSGKILYWGISDSPAWLCSELFSTSKIRGWASPMGIQVEYSLLERSVESELIPFADYHGLAVLGWGPLAGGMLTGKHRGESSVDTLRGDRAALRRTPRNDAIIDSLCDLSEKMHCTPAQLAIRWIQQKHSACIPILGARTEHQIRTNISASSIDIDKDTFAELNKISSVNLGFPNTFLASSRTKEVMFGPFNIE